MTQENPTPDKSREARKKILLGVLFAVLLGVVYLQFFSGDDEPQSTGPTAGSSVRTVRPEPSPGLRPRPGASPEIIISQPLDLASMSSRSAGGEGTGRNIFIYPPPPPPPTPKPLPPQPTPPPPPVNLFSVNPAGVIARTGDQNLTLFGEKIPQDGRVYVDGREYPTTFVSEREIKAKLPADAIRNAGNLGVMVRSVGDAKIFSNQLSLNVAEPPPPPYRFIGLIVKKSGSTAVLKVVSPGPNEEDVINVTKDKIFGRNNNWKVISITPQKIVLEDTNLKVTHTLNFTGENG